MKRKLLITAVAIMAIVTSIFMFGCNSNDEEIVFDDELLAHENTLTEGSNVRVMSYNVQVNAWGGKDRAKPKFRANRLEQVLMYYAPDVVGLQEFCESWHFNQTSRMKANYKVMFDGMFEYTSLAYNKNTVKVVEKGKLKYSKHHEKVIQMMRVACWGVFEKIETGEKFIVTSTHFDFKPNVETMELQGNELTDLVNELVEKYDCPVFCLGDFNFYEKEKVVKVDEEGKEILEPSACVDVYKKFVETSGLVETKLMDGIIKENGSGDKWDEATWDHIFVKPGTDVKKYSILSDKEYYSKVSDHYPVIVDAKI